MASDFLTCQELVELITDYLDGVMPNEQRVAFEGHIAICPPCRGYLAEIRRTVQVAGTLTEDMIPPEGRDVMLRAFRDWKRDEWSDPQTH